MLRAAFRTARRASAGKAPLSALSPSTSLSPAASAACRLFSSKSPRTRVEQHPQQQKRHQKAANAAAQVIQHADEGATITEAFSVAEEAQPETLASSPSASSAAASAAAAEESEPINVSSRLISSEPAPRRRPPEEPSEFDAAGRAVLRTKLHPAGAVVGRGRVVANFGTRMLVQEMPWEANGASTNGHAASVPTPAADPPHPSSPLVAGALEEGLRFIALPRGKLGKIVCGDLVLWEWSSNHQDSSAFIVEVLPRETEFRRAERGTSGSQTSVKLAREEVLLASNFHHMCIVCASEPATNATLLDRYLSAAQRMGVSSSIIFNKVDLPAAKRFEQDMADFEALGVRVFRTSCAPGHVQGIEELRKHLATLGPQPGKGITIFVGQSGSGKSSLLNTLSPSLQLAVNSLSRKLQGRHTTTQTILHTLESGGEIIDSPGFQNFQPSPVPLKDVVKGFTEMQAPAKLCHYGARCMHLAEPGCAVRLCIRSSKGGASTEHKGTAEASAQVQSVPPVPPVSTDPADQPLLNPGYISPEAAFFSAFQAARARELGDSWNPDIKDMHVPGGEGDPSDEAGDPDALAASRNKAWGARQIRREMDHDAKRDMARDMAQIEKENARMKQLAQAAAKGEILDASTDESGTSLSQPRSHSADRALHLTHHLAEQGLLDTISQRRYRSYVELVRQQVELDKHKYD